MKKIMIILWLMIILAWLLFFKVIVGTGNSMMPTIPNKAILLCMKQNDYKIGDIVNYQLGKYSVVHRIIERIDDGVVVQYRLKGDGNKSPDKYLITKTNIKCKVLI